MNKHSSLFAPHVDSCINSSGVSHKCYLLKRKIIVALAQEPVMTVSELAALMGVSAPTIAKLLNDLIEAHYVQDMGKVETPGGRRPCSFSLVGDSGYFLGVEVGENCLRFALANLNSEIIKTSLVENFNPINSPKTLEKIIEEINHTIDSFLVDRAKVLGVGLILRGRVDSISGHSYNYLNFNEKPLSQVMSKRLCLRTIVENDTRAVAYAQYVTDDMKRNIQNSLFLYLGRGVGVGIIINGKLYYGKSGFAGEFGHIPFFDNQIICHCGKKGCLETEASGDALERMFQEELANGASSILSEEFATKGHVNLDQIVEAATADDVLSIEIIGKMGETLGRALGVLLNIFNPEAIVVGGVLANAGDYLMLPLRSALAKYSLSLVNNDSILSVSTLGEMGPVIGGALLTRNHVLSVEKE
ncbi:MAG: ROK family transcriptional regulator [Mucinivorans sp.]